MRRLGPLPPRPPSPDEERRRVLEQASMLLNLLDTLQDGAKDLRAFVEVAERQASSAACPAILAALRAQLPSIAQAADAVKAIADRAGERIDRHLAKPAA